MEEHSFDSSTQYTIFTESDRMTLNTRETDGGNNNVIVVGSSGTGKTHNFLKPNILQCNTNMVISDAKGTLFKECGHVLERNGYTIKILNLQDLSRSMRYNPFHYIENENDIEYLALCMASSMSNGKERSAGSGDTYWLEMATILLKALIGAVFYEFSFAERNIDTMLKLFEMAGVEQYNEESDLTRWFHEIEQKSKISYHVRNYNMFESQAGADRTQASCLGVVGSILAQWQLSSVRNLTLYDELELYHFDERKTALFVIYDDTDPSKNFLSNILYSQFFKLMIRKAESSDEGRLRIPIRFYLDDFANTTIPGFVDMIATIRSREISACIIVQSESQLQAKYGIDSDTIIENCAAYVFTGTSGVKTAKAVAERFDLTLQEVLHLPSDSFLAYMDRSIRKNKKFRPETHPNYLPGYYDYTKAIDRERKKHAGLEKMFAKQIAEYQDMLSISHGIREENKQAVEKDNLIVSSANAHISQTPVYTLKEHFFRNAEEQTFYSLLLTEIRTWTEVSLGVHVPLKEIFTAVRESNDEEVAKRISKFSFEKAENNISGKQDGGRLQDDLAGINCDFVLRDINTFRVIIAIDVQDEKNTTEPEQRQQEARKESLFRENHLDYIRVKPRDFDDEWWDIAVVNAIKRSKA